MNDVTLDQILLHTVYEAGPGPNGSGGDWHYWKDGDFMTLESALTDYIDGIVKEVIGEDEMHDNGHKMVNDPSTCMDCTNPDERFARNRLRAEQRQRLKERMGQT
jgi:hypothetical protein